MPLRAVTVAYPARSRANEITSRIFALVVGDKDSRHALINSGPRATGANGVRQKVVFEPFAAPGPAAPAFRTALGGSGPRIAFDHFLRQFLAREAEGA